MLLVVSLLSALLVRFGVQRVRHMQHSFLEAGIQRCKGSQAVVFL